ncbi:HVO_0234 family beta-propeller protein, partial [Halorubrum halophilum]
MAPAEDDISIEEKRVYAGTAGRTDAYVATESGVVRVALSADKVGAFDMVAREPARDVAVLARDDGPDLVGIATADGLHVAVVG